MLIAPDLGDISAGSFERSDGRDPDRRGGDARARRHAAALQPAARAVRGAARDAGRRGARRSARSTRSAFEGLKRTNPEVLRALVESKPGEPLDRGRRSAPTCGASTARGDFESIGYRIVGARPARARWSSSRARSRGGPTTCASASASPATSRATTSSTLLVAVPQDLAQPPGRRVADRGAGRAGHALVHRVLPAARTRPAAGSSRRTRRSGSRRAASSTATTRSPTTSSASVQGGLDVGAVLGTWGQLRVGPCRGRASMRGSTPAHRCCPRRARPTAGLRAALFVDQLDARVVPARGLLARRDRATPRWTSLGSEASYSGSKAAARGIKSWGPHTFNLGVAGGTVARTPTCRPTSRSRSAARCGCRPTGSTSSPAAQYAFGRLMYYNRTIPLPDLLGIGRLRRRLGRSRPHQRSLRRPAVAGNAVVGLDLPRRRHVRRPAVPRRGCRRRTLESVPAARRAVAPAQPPGRRG